jgi:hypothetical protein
MVQDIVLSTLPSTRALGTHAFHPSLGAPPSFVINGVDEGGDESVAMEDESTSSDSSGPITSFSGQSSSANLGAKIQPAIAINGMQGAVNRLIVMFEKSIATQQVGLATLGQAVKRLQDVDDGLSAMEKVVLIRQFEKNVATANAYLSLTDQALRRLWIRSKLGSMQDKLIHAVIQLK